MAKKKAAKKKSSAKKTKSVVSKKKTIQKSSKLKAGAKKIKSKAPVKKTKSSGSGVRKVLQATDVFTASPIIQKEGAKIRVLVGKAGLDGHDRGAKIIARACRDAGFEVVYTGLHQTPDMIVNTAIQEDVDVLGLSILSGAHNYLVPEIIKKLETQGVKVGKDILIVVGGIIPDSDFQSLKSAGVNMVFTPGAPVESIIEYIRGHVQPKG